jgi:hypothetical protein
MSRIDYNPHTDGNVFYWIVKTAELVREERRKEREQIKQAVAEGEYKYDYKRYKFI